MHDTGMTDLQFKSYIRQMSRNIEEARSETAKIDTDKKLEVLLRDLKEDLQG